MLDKYTIKNEERRKKNDYYEKNPTAMTTVIVIFFCFDRKKSTFIFSYNLLKRKWNKWKKLRKKNRMNKASNKWRKACWWLFGWLVGLFVELSFSFSCDGDRNIACMMLITLIVTIVFFVQEKWQSIFYFVNRWLWWGVEQFFPWFCYDYAKMSIWWIKKFLSFNSF